MTPTIHASAVLLGYRGIVIRGPSGAGKSRLALALLQAADAGLARLIGDDRLRVRAAHGRLLIAPAETLEGLIEIRGLGIARVPFEPLAVAHLVVDLAASDAERLPESAAAATEIAGVNIARLPVAPGADPLPLLHAALRYKWPLEAPPAHMNP